MLQRLELAERPPELLARLEVLVGQRLHPVHDADRFGGERRHAAPRRLLDQREAIADLADDRIGRHGDVVERDFRRPQAVDGAVGAAGNAPGVAVDEEERDALLVAPRARAPRGDDDPVRAAAVQHDALVAAQNVAVALPGRRGLDIEQVVARLPLREGEGELHSPLRHLRQNLAFRRLIAALQHQVGAEHDGGEIRLDDQPAAEALHDDHRLGRAAADPAVFLRQRRAEPAELRHRAPVVAAETIRRGHELAPVREVVILAHEAVDAVFQELLFFAERKVHGSPCILFLRGRAPSWR